VAAGGSDVATVADVGPTVPAVSPSPRALRTIEIDNTLPATATSGVASLPKRRSLTPLLGAGLVVALALGGVLFSKRSRSPSAEIVPAATPPVSASAAAPETPSSLPPVESSRLEVVPVPAELPSAIPSVAPAPPAVAARPASVRPKASKPKSGSAPDQFLEHRK
jgi:hypothetical protein